MKILKEYFALPAILGIKSKRETFPGAISDATAQST